MSAQTLRNRVNRELRPYNRNYFDAIPLGDIFEVVRRNIGEVIDIDGLPWQGLLCGEDGRCNFQIRGFRCGFLYLTWHTMPSGRYEIVVYVS